MSSVDAFTLGNIYRPSQLANACFGKMRWGLRTIFGDTELFVHANTFPLLKYMSYDSS